MRTDCEKCGVKIGLQIRFFYTKIPTKEEKLIENEVNGWLWSYKEKMKEC